MFKKTTIEPMEKPSTGAPQSNRASSEPRTPAASNVEISRETIAKLAFQKWQKRGCPSGEDQRDWFEAERELKSPQAARSRRG